MGRKKKDSLPNSSDQEELQKHSHHHQKLPSQRRKSQDNIIPNPDINDDPSPSQEIEAAIKTMKFRDKRGTRMKDLMTGKVRLDNFWEENAKYFGGHLDFPEDQDEEDGEYEQSSSGRDQFDSDFDETDSYPGKRGRKKANRYTKKKRGRKPGRKPKQVKQQKSENQKNQDENNQEEKSQEDKKSSQNQQKKQKQKQQKREPMATRSKEAKPKKQKKHRIKEQGEKKQKKQKLKEKKEKKKQTNNEKGMKTSKKDKKMRQDVEKSNEKQYEGDRNVCLRLQMSLKVEIKEGSRKNSIKSPLSCQGSKDKNRQQSEHSKTIKFDIPPFKL